MTSLRPRLCLMPLNSIFMCAFLESCAGSRHTLPTSSMICVFQIHQLFIRCEESIRCQRTAAGPLTSNPPMPQRLCPYQAYCMSNSQLLEFPTARNILMEELGHLPHAANCSLCSQGPSAQIPSKYRFSSASSASSVCFSLFDLVYRRARSWSRTESQMFHHPCQPDTLPDINTLGASWTVPGQDHGTLSPH